MAKSLVLIGDIVASREIEQREELQQNLRQILDTVNEQNEGLISPYTITLGDEFQAMYTQADHLFEHLVMIMAKLHPVQVRFSIGIGSIDTPVNKKQAIGMDGPAFHEAREGIKALKGSGFLFSIRVEGEDNSTLKIINSSLTLIGHQMKSWKKNRLTILYMLMQGKDYKSITKKLDISRVAFYKNKETALLDVIDNLSDNIARILNKKIAT